MPKNPSDRGGVTLPPSIAALKSRSVEARKRVLRNYLNLRAVPVRPPYLDDSDIVKTHLQRSAMELSGSRPPRSVEESYQAHTLSKAGPYTFDASSGALTELCVGVMGEVLGARAELQVAAGFFSTMVACVDDYLDREGSYGELGERLIFISHCYRDMMDIALHEQVSAGRLSEGEVRDIKVRLFEVIKTLAGSEAAADAHSYLYEKSCGDKVIGVLFPASAASEPDKKMCAEIGRLVGEAGQLIDDIMDYDTDMETGGRNYISQTGISLDGAIEGAAGRVSKARRVADGLKDNGAILWVLDALDEAAGLMRDKNAGEDGSGRRLLAGSSYLRALVPDLSLTGTFLIWF